MDLRRAETGLAWFTLGVLVIYFPVETWASLPHGLWSPFYIVDLIAMALLLWGAFRSLRSTGAFSRYPLRGVRLDRRERLAGHFRQSVRTYERRQARPRSRRDVRSLHRHCHRIRVSVVVAFFGCAF